METRQSTRFRQVAGAPPATDLRPWELCWHTDGKLYIGVGDTDGHATSVEQISGAGASWLGSMAYINDAPSDGKTYGRKDGAWAVESGGSSDTSANLIENSNAQYGTEEWATAGSTLTVVTHLDRKCFKLVQSSSYGYIADDVVLSSPEVGKTYSFAADIAGSVSGTPAIIMIFLDSGGGSLGTYVNNITLTDTFQRFAVEGKTCPSGTAKIRCQLRTSGSSDTFYYGRCKLERNDTATAYTQEAAVQRNAEKVASASVTNIVVTNTTPTSNSANSGKLYLVY